MERDGLGPNSINHLRRVLLGIFRRATKAGLWYRPNPIEAVETRREHEPALGRQKALGDVLDLPGLGARVIHLGTLSGGRLVTSDDRTGRTDALRVNR